MTRKTSTFQGNRTTSPTASITPIPSPSPPDGRPTPTVNPSAPATTKQKPLAKEPESLSPSKMLNRLDRDHLESTFDGEIVEKLTSRVVKPIVSRLDLLESTINSHVSVTFSDWVETEMASCLDRLQYTINTHIVERVEKVITGRLDRLESSVNNLVANHEVQQSDGLPQVGGLGSPSSNGKFCLLHLHKVSCPSQSQIHQRLRTIQWK